MASLEPYFGVGSRHALAGILEHDLVLGAAAYAEGRGELNLPVPRRAAQDD